MRLQSRVPVNAPWSSAEERNSMERHKSDAANGGKIADIDANEPADGFDELAESQDELIATAATVAVVGAGVIIFEAALLPGLVLGIATMLVPKYLPRLGGAVRPPSRPATGGPSS